MVTPCAHILPKGMITSSQLINAIHNLRLPKVRSDHAIGSWMNVIELVFNNEEKERGFSMCVNAHTLHQLSIIIHSHSF